MIVGDGVGLVGDEDGVSVVEYMRLKNIVAVGLGEEEDGDGDVGGTVIYDVVGVPVFDA